MKKAMVMIVMSVLLTGCMSTKSAMMQVKLAQAEKDIEQARMLLKLTGGYVVTKGEYATMRQEMKKMAQMLLKTAEATDRNTAAGREHQEALRQLLGKGQDQESVDVSEEKIEGGE